MYSVDYVDRPSIADIRWFDLVQRARLQFTNVLVSLFCAAVSSYQLLQLNSLHHYVYTAE